MEDLTKQINQSVQNPPTPLPSAVVSPVSPVIPRTKVGLKLILAVAFLLILLAIILGIRLVGSSRTKEPGGEPAKPTSTTSEGGAANICRKVYDELVTKYTQDYKSCLKGTGATAADCKKPEDGVADTFKDNLNVLVILDSSGSMGETVSGGQKMQIAKQVITNFVSSLPPRTKLGLMVYGHKGSNSQSQKAVSCAGIEMVYLLSEMNQTAFVNAVNSFNPTGWTPIEDSFKKAKEVLNPYGGETNSNLVYLVSDGLETCGGNPANGARDLHESNIKAMVNIVGFDVDNEAQQQLKAAAEAGGGDYYQANTAEEMKKVFENQQKWISALREYRDCLIGSTRAKRDLTIEEIRAQRDCAIEMLRKQRDDILTEAREKRDNKTLDWDCASTIINSTWDNSNKLINAVWDTSMGQIWGEWGSAQKTINDVWEQTGKDIDKVGN